MSRTLYKILGSCAILAAISLVMQAREILATRPPTNLTEFYFGTAFLIGLCLVSAIICFFPRSHPVTLRVIGVVGVISTLYYLYDSFHNHKFAQVGTALVFWLPGSIYLIMKGKMTD